MTGLAVEAAVPFEVLSQEVRIEILEALVERRVEEPQDPVASFSELRDRVGVADSGRFNYHLNRLVGLFVQKRGDGYELNAAGREVAGAILSGSFEGGSEQGPTDVDAPCRQCDGTVTVQYEDGRISAKCENEHLNHCDYFPPSIAERTSLSNAIRLATLMGQQNLELVLQNVCPKCYSEIAAEVSRDERVPVLEIHCDRCGHFMQGPVSLVVLTHPVLCSFYLERGKDIRTVPLWSLPFLTDPDRLHIESKDPLQVEIDASFEGDELTFLVGADGSVIEYTRERH